MINARKMPKQKKEPSEATLSDVGTYGGSVAENDFEADLEADRYR